MRTESSGCRRDHLRALAQRVEVDAKEVRIMGSKSELLRTLVAASSAKTAGFGVPVLFRSAAPDTIRTGVTVA
jgi:site-specific DNA recombinase